MIKLYSHFTKNLVKSMLASKIVRFSDTNTIKITQNSQIKSQIYQIIENYCQNHIIRNKKLIKPASELLNENAEFKSLGFDKIDEIEFLCLFEDFYNIDFSDSEIQNLKNIHDLINLLMMKINKK